MVDSCAFVDVVAAAAAAAVVKIDPLHWMGCDSVSQLWQSVVRFPQLCVPY